MTGSLNVYIKRLVPEAVIPSYAHTGDAGVDLVTTEDFTLEPFERRLVSTGIAIELPDGYAGFVMPRSGLAVKHGISIVNTPGLVDSNYRGELKVTLVNMDSHEVFKASKGERIAQLVIAPVSTVSFIEVEELSDSNRSANGFGSSGR